MKFALVGYGKMGHMIAQSARLRGHTLVLSADPFADDAVCTLTNPDQVATAIVDSGAEAIIEFSHPTSVLANIHAFVPTGIPLIVGTTGWLDRLDEIKKVVYDRGSAFLYASNFSVGVNLFYRMVSQAAQLMSAFEEYDAAVFESHHNQKADSPSGTALDVARRVMENLPRKKRLVSDAFYRKPDPDELHVASVRVGSVPGTHTVFFDSTADTIELTHRARSREGFALGAVRAMEWLTARDMHGHLRRGVFTMDDYFAEL